MKTKLFLFFLIVIFIALVSNFIFNSLIQRDFKDYVRGSREDQLYWVLAAVEGSYGEGRWDEKSLAEALHWGMMLGFELRISDINGQEVTNTHNVLEGLGEGMRRRMESMIDMSAPMEAFDNYPLYVKGEEIGVLSARTLKRRGNLAEKENIFRKHGKEFLVISFIIAGGGAVFLSLLFSIFLTKPVRRLKEATENIARGDFGAKVDISSMDEIGKLADSFNFMSEALKREDMIRKHLTSNIAHELRTPLTIMKANFEGILDGVVECSHEQVNSLREEVERLINLVEGIEDITRAEVSFLKEGTVEKIDVSEIVERIIMSVQNMADKREVEFEYKKEEVLEVVTDREKINGIIKNLLTNALKFTKKGIISIDYGIKDSRYYIRIKDTGRGMDREETEHIFDRFYKGSGSNGTGIGLSIVKELVTALGGNIEVKSEPGKGSEFTVFVPQGEIKD